MTTAYNIIWLGQNLPGFTTKTAAVLPFRVQQSRLNLGEDRQWISETVVYSTNLTCSPAKIDQTSEGNTYDNGKGCVTSPGYLDYDGSVEPQFMSIGWYMDQHINYALSQMGCSSDEFSHTFLAFVGTGQNESIRSTAIFCEPSYWSQEANVTVSAQNQSVLNITPLGSPSRLSPNVFNISNFEYVIGTGAVFRSRRADIPDTMSNSNASARLLSMGLGPESVDGNLVGFALGSTQLPIEDYLNPETLASSYEEAHQLLFALAIGTLYAASKNSENTSANTLNSRPTITEGTQKTIFVVRDLTIIIESFLGIVTILTFALTYVAWRRISQLQTDPDSLEEVMRLLDNSQLLPNTSGAEATEGEVYANIEQGKLNLTINATQPSQLHGDRSTIRSIMKSADACRRPVLPLEMRYPVAGVFITLLFIALITTILLNITIRNQNGLPQPSSKPEINQILTNYGPVLLATFLEPFWLLLNRMLCILKPFEELRRGDVNPSTSIHLKYTTLPPQLTIWRALKAHHYLLVAVCAVGLSANVLSVALGAIFTTDLVSHESSYNFSTRSLPVFLENVIDPSSIDPFYVANANLTTGTNLPPWTTSTRFFLPLSPHPDDKIESDQTMYKVVSRGFGIEVECDAAEDPTTAVLSNFNESIVIPPKFADNRRLTCAHQPTDTPYGGQNFSRSAIEDLTLLDDGDSSDQEAANLCNRLFAATLVRANLTMARNIMETDDTLQPTSLPGDLLGVNSFSSMRLVCQPSFVTAPYSIVVDRSGVVMSAVQIGQNDENIQPFFNSNFTVDDLITATGKIWNTGAYTGAWWHNDTYADSWFPFFAKTLSKNTSLIDPLQPLPSSDTLSPIVGDVVSRVFAITLSLNPTIFKQASSNVTYTGSQVLNTERIFMSRTAFVITITLLAMNIIVAIFYYAKRPKRILPQMPTTVASLLELFDGSSLVDEIKIHNQVPRDWKIGYGRFIGTDGKLKIGIERRPFVIPWGDS